jgi:hypothetical protein
MGSQSMRAEVRVNAGRGERAHVRALSKLKHKLKHLRHAGRGERAHVRALSKAAYALSKAAAGGSESKCGSW